MHAGSCLQFWRYWMPLCDFECSHPNNCLPFPCRLTPAFHQAIYLLAELLKLVTDICLGPPAG